MARKTTTPASKDQLLEEFQALVSDHKIGFKTVYHNGLVERAVTGTWAKLGGEPHGHQANGVTRTCASGASPSATA